MLNRIREGAAAMGLNLPENALERFSRFQEMLLRANEQFNLTRVPDDPAEAADRNYLDSLSLLASVPEVRLGTRTLLDLGSGAGFPGIPLSIAMPETRVTLMDSLGKRVSFLNRVIEELGLNAVAVHARAEEAAKLPSYRERFDLVTARAVAAMPTLTEWAMPFVRVGGIFAAYKGPSVDEELSRAQSVIRRTGGEGCRVLSASIPGHADWDHRIALIRKTNPTPKSFPRKPGEAGRNPILG